MARINTWTRLICISSLVLIADQLTKAMIKASFALHEQWVVIDHFFNITYVMNPGGAFGFFATGSPVVRKFIFLFLSSIVALFVLWLYHQCVRDYVFLSCGLSLIFGGAVGNLVDRFRYGMVVDFLDFYIGAVHWPAFNVADSAITVGMGILIYHILFNKTPHF